MSEPENVEFYGNDPIKIYRKGLQWGVVNDPVPDVLLPTPADAIRRATQIYQGNEENE